MKHEMTDLEFAALMAPYRARIEKIAAAFDPNEQERVNHAFEFACTAHWKQLRKSGEPYICHPVETAEILADLGLDDDTLVAGLLHDCIEDTKFTYEDVQKAFGTTVADLVEGVTKLKSFVYSSREEAQMESLRKMFVAMAHDIRVIIIKLADRLHNVRTLEFQKPVRQQEIALETMEIYSPLAHRLGMHNMKEELDDLSLRILDPVGYAEIQSYLNGREAEFQGFLEQTKERIGEKMAASHIDCEIKVRLKHVYSIYRKLYGQNLAFNEMYDLCATRIIVKTVFDCYNVFGLIHDMYRPIPGRFKDYISTPKPNGYQSLHTVVIGSEGIPFEVQIRTREMDTTAEYGIAAHWKYKGGLKGKQKEESFAWIRQLLEVQQDTDAEDFIKNMKTDLFDDEVYVFTPKGDVVNLPAGATPIDFAYAIHSEVGNRMVGAKVNGMMVAIDHELKNGEIVDVVTSKTSPGPRRDWMQIVKTNSAKTKIRQWFKKEKREENIEHGRQTLDRELRVNLVYDLFYHEETQAGILKSLGFPNVTELYASLGFGGITVAKVVSKVREEHTRQQKAREADPLAKIMQPRRKPVADTGVFVEGIDNCLIKFAKCCTPIPGDEIIGFITRGYGVSVHRIECANVKASLGKAEEYGRWIKTEWDYSEKHKYRTGIKIIAKTRTGVLQDVVTIFSNMKINIDELTVRDMPDGQSLFYMTITVSGKEQLELLTARLRRVEGVSDIVRNLPGAIAGS